MADLFISYKAEDRAPVQRLVQALRGAGASVWWDQDIAPGAPWEVTIERELHQAKAVIVAWSPMAVASENVKEEARWARRQGRLIQVFVAPCAPPLFFGERQGVDLSGWKGDPADHRFKAVLAAAQAVVAGRAPPQGVGYARPRRKVSELVVAAAVVLSAVLGLIANLAGTRDAVCRLSALEPLCRRWGLVAPPPPDPAVLAAQARRKLIQGVAGTWDRQDRACAAPIRIGVATDEDGVSRLTVTGAKGYVSVGQVIAADNGAVMTRNSTAGPGGRRDQWEYRPDGDQLTVIDKDGVATPLVRCQARS